MPWVRFIKDYDFKPTPAVTIAYKAGMTEYVTRRCATLAIASEKAARAEQPPGRFARKGRRLGQNS
jgi:hypothetical protein